MSYTAFRLPRLRPRRFFMQKIAILYDASQAVLSTFDLDEVFKRILSILRDYFQLQNCGILLLDPDSNELVLRMDLGWSKEQENTRIPVGHGLTGSAALQKRPVYAADVTQDARYLAGIESTRSELCIPLMVRDEVVGVLDCQSDKPNYFDSETIDLLMLFSTQASIAIVNARLHALEQKRATQLEAINAIARQTTVVRELSEIIDQVCTLILEAFPVEHVTLLQLQEDALVLRAQRGSLTPLLEAGTELPARAGLSGRALSTGAPVVVNDVRSDPAYIAGSVEARSELCLPLISFGHPVGALSLTSARLNAFQDTDIKPLESVADICAAAIQNADYFDRVRQLAYRDGLTGTFNRRYFETRILEEIERALRYDSSLSVLMVDIDGFKRLNDEFGHLLGDEALRRVSAIFTHNLRKVDIICRFGGDEFAILLPETTADKAIGAAEKLRARIAACEFPGVARPVTISIGIAACPQYGRTRDELIKSADAALYQAKQAGRNRVTCASVAAP